MGLSAVLQRRGVGCKGQRFSGVTRAVGVAIRVKCPNGHTLKVPDNFAGRMGMCPVCKAKVRVPRAGPQTLSEEAIMDLIDTGEERSGTAEAGAEEAGRGVSAPREPMKGCDQCGRQIPALLHICPHCHTYIASLTDA